MRHFLQVFFLCYLQQFLNEIKGSQILEIMEQKKTLSAELEHLREEAYKEQAEHEAEHEHEGHEHHHDHHEHEHHHDHDDHDEHEHHHDHDHDEHEHHHHHHHDGHHHADEVFEDFGAETTHKYTKDQIRKALEGLQNIAEVGQVLRAKGIVEGEDGQWIHFDYVPGEPDVRTGSAEQRPD